MITKNILSYTSAVTELHQKKSNDILQASYQLIESAKAQFHDDIRANVDIFHEEWYDCFRSCRESLASRKHPSKL